MEKALHFAKEKGSSYAEAVTINKERTSIEISNSQSKELSSGAAVMYAVRVLHNGKWGTAASYKESPQQLVRKAIQNSKACDGKINIPKMPSEKASLNTKTKTDPSSISLDKKRDDLFSLDKLKRNYKKVSSLTLMYGDSITNYHFTNTEGRDIAWNDTTVGIIARAFAKNKGVVENAWKVERGHCGYELMKNGESAVKEAMEKATKLLSAKQAKGGMFPVIADNKLTGVFTHEAIGHACEADIVLNDGSILIDKLNKRIGPELVSVYDDGQIKEWGYTPYDEEGIKSKKTWLIKKGILNSYMHNRETAEKFNVEPTGNGRSQAPNYRIIPRMTCTVMAQGDSNFDEMIQEVKEGYYLKDSAGGQVNPATGEFLFNAAEGYYVKNGEIKHMVKGVSLVGDILKTLFEIQLLSNELKYGKGFCGKSGQAVPVSEAGPHMLLRKTMVGGQQ